MHAAHQDPARTDPQTERLAGHDGLAGALPDPAYQPEFYDGVVTKRAIAWLLDTLIIVTLTLVILPFTAFTALFFYPLFYLVVGFAYRVLTISGHSNTWGMRLMSIELRDARGQRLDFAGALLHTLGYTLSIGTFMVQALSIVLMLGSERRQGLTDMVMGTVMLNRRA